MKPLIVVSKVLIISIALMVTVFGWAESRFSIKNNNIYDHKTNLIWKRCSEGLTWSDEKQVCEGIKTKYSFDELNEKFAGNDWRVPTIDELKSLIKIDRLKDLQIDVEIFSDMKRGDQTNYWSATASSQYFGWCVFFDDGIAFRDARRNNRFPVRLVKDGWNNIK